MTDKLGEAIDRLREVLKEESAASCVAVELFINHDDYDVTYHLRFRSENASYRNLRGEWVE